jgi:formate-dependent nitrite reductase cytochrome c552 subunit
MTKAVIKEKLEKSQKDLVRMRKDFVSIMQHVHTGERTLKIYADTVDVLRSAEKKIADIIMRNEEVDRILNNLGGNQ